MHDFDTPRYLTKVSFLYRVLQGTTMWVRGERKKRVSVIQNTAPRVVKLSYV